MPVFALAVEGGDERLFREAGAPIQLQSPFVRGGYRQHETRTARLPDLLRQSQQERPAQPAALPARSYVDAHYVEEPRLVEHAEQLAATHDIFANMRQIYPAG